MTESALKEFKIYLRPGPTDMRKAINGLAAIVQDEIRLNPYERSLFVFSNRRGDLIKILYWDFNGFCLWHKRLEKHRFFWPQTPEAVMSITLTELRLLLLGVDFRNVHETLDFAKAG